jgi:hypothetical protein
MKAGERVPHGCLGPPPNSRPIVQSCSSSCWGPGGRQPDHAPDALHPYWVYSRGLHLAKSTWLKGRWGRKDPALPPSPFVFQALPFNKETSATSRSSKCKTCTSINVSIFLKVLPFFFPQFFLDVDTELQYKGGTKFSQFPL